MHIASLNISFALLLATSREKWARNSAFKAVNDFRCRNQREWRWNETRASSGCATTRFRSRSAPNGGVDSVRRGHRGGARGDRCRQTAARERAHGAARVGVRRPRRRLRQRDRDLEPDLPRLHYSQLCRKCRAPSRPEARLATGTRHSRVMYTKDGFFFASPTLCLFIVLLDQLSSFVSAFSLSM